MVPTDFASPWTEGNLSRVVFSDIFGQDVDVVDRSVAMKVAPIKRARSIIVGALADLPLVAVRDSKPADRQPAWLTSTRTVESVQHRMAWTIDDLLFSGWSLWAVNRSEDTGTILDAVRVAPSRWKFDPETPLGIRVDDTPVTDERSVILFRGFDEGILATGADVIRGARAMDKSWVGRATNPIPAMVLHEVSDGGTRVTPEAAQEYVNQWSKARKSPDGAVGFLPSSLQMETYGTVNADLYVEGRNALRIDVANMTNLPASLLDGSAATASLTYQTAQGNFSQLNEYLDYWASPIEARLSMDDVTPHGQVIRFDRSSLSLATTYGPSAPPVEASEPQTPEVAS
ncbi:hypothetical protein DBR36_01540 [Microbacterium sp. HMWF026]|uniref:phage portal protein n=1 Tax=Microbacterium sp. HMWF026 TaxID=2056861 RepID=UPI000D3994DF|nr:phage portal protein [Microbacterium sp. HMWF026]PTT22618.1 hypothetical protein DBR36_01540 [Microbacterium sp. HMWF026]